MVVVWVFIYDIGKAIFIIEEVGAQTYACTCGYVVADDTLGASALCTPPIYQAAGVVVVG